MQAVILAAGKGTRLPEITAEIPKPLVRINGKSVLERNIENLVRHGVTELFINLHHLPDLIREALGDGSRLGARIAYNFEAELLGTAGALLGFEDRLEDEFFLLYGDTLREVDYTAMRRLHRERKAHVTIALHEVEDPSSAGIVVLDEHRRITTFVEKPKGPPPGRLANAGVYLLPHAIMDHVRRKAPPVDFAYDIFPALLEEGSALYGFPLEGVVIDIGTPERLAQAKEIWKG